MSSYTGTTKKGDDMGRDFPFLNPANTPDLKTYWKSKVFHIKTKIAIAAIGTDDYTYPLFTAPRALLIEAAYLVDPVGQGVDAANYNTYAVETDAPLTLCQVPDAYGWKANQLVEIRRTSTTVNRTLAAGDVIQLNIAGTASGRIINADVEVIVVCSLL